MTAHEPTAEHTDAVAKAVCPYDPPGWLHSPAHSLECRDADRVVRAILTTTDPAAQAALAASLPAEVILAALVDRGTLRYVVTNADGSKVWLQEVAP